MTEDDRAAEVPLQDRQPPARRLPIRPALPLAFFAVSWALSGWSMDEQGWARPRDASAVLLTSAGIGVLAAVPAACAGAIALGG